MPKRKLSNLTLDKAALKTKFSKSNSSSPEENSNKSIIDSTPKCWLQILPNEVLELIYSFLSPRTLISMASLNCGRISDLTRKARCADFSSCYDILPAEMQEFFSANVTRHIRQINFTNLFLVNTPDLVKFIMRCKHLTSLTVIECKVKFEHMQHILQRCKLLRELHWNVLTEKNDVLELSELQIKKLYLHIDSPTSSQMAFSLLKKCPVVSEACFNYTSLLFPHLPLTTCQKNVIYKLHSYPNCPVSIVLDDYFENMQSVYECIMATKWCNCSNPVGSLHMPITAPFLQVVANPDEYPSLASIPDQSVQKLVLYYSNEVFLLQKMQDIKRVIGKRLKFLAVKEVETLSMKKDADNEEEDKTFMSEIVPNLISSCCYIQVLILSPTHFSEPLKLEALHCLKGLKTLGLTSCALKSDQYQYPDKKLTCQQQRFEELVKNIKDLEHFSIRNCGYRCRGPKDKELSGISKWIRLKTLSIVNVDSLQFCNFLRDIAVECPNFKSLEILDTSSLTMVYHYIPSVMTLLSLSSQLMQLCMNLDILCVRNRRFWDAISSAKTLQSLCLTLTSPTGVTPKSVADAVQELPLLHIFHLNSPTVNEGLELRVTRIMKRHGVKYPKVEVTTINTFIDNQNSCDSPHLYIP